MNKAKRGNNRPYIAVDIRQNLDEIEASLCSISDILFFGVEPSINAFEDNELNEDNLRAKEEIINFLEEVEELISKYYFASKSELMNRAMW